MKRIGRLRWWIIGLVTLGTVLNYLARSTLSVAAPTLKEEMGLTTEEYSYIVMAFQATYTVMQSVAGSVLDALGNRLGFFLFAVGWALANMAHGLATGWQGLAFFRGLLGATEAAAIPAGTKTVAQWFPPRERPLATSAFQIGTSFGSILAPPIVIFCIVTWGWQSAFMVTGALSLVWAGMWWIGYRDPVDHKRLTAEERAHIEGGRDVEAGVAKPATRSEVLKSRGFWAIAIPRFLAEPAWQTFNFFIPLYLVAVWNVDLAGIAMTVGALCMGGLAFIGLAGSPEVAIALFCLGGFAHQMLNGALLTLCSDVFDARAVGTASGMAGTVAWIGGLGFTFLIGQSADAYGYNPLFIALAALDLVGAAVLWSLLRGERSMAQA